MNSVLNDLIAIVDHAIERGELPEGVSPASAAYVADIVRIGAKRMQSGNRTNEEVESSWANQVNQSQITH